MTDDEMLPTLLQEVACHDTVAVRSSQLLSRQQKHVGIGHRFVLLDILHV